MEMLPSLAVKGGVKLPVGFRFRPTDEELIVHYLRKIALGLPLPAPVIPVLDVFHTDPWKFPGVGDADSMENGYFFSEKNDIFYGGVIVIAEGTGFWKPVGDEIPIVCPRTNLVIGTRKTLVFCGGDTETQWVMHELRLAGPAMNVYPPKILPSTKWAVYRVFQEETEEEKKKPKEKRSKKKKSTKNKKIRKLEADEGVKPSVIDFDADGNNSGEAPPPPPASPSLSEGSDITSSN
ncbi:hypothetical protein K1719_007753 [Acacia pycnantha]|nr:hypothetical protein K1719_007753 [Acacia pycnantha]